VLQLVAWLVAGLVRSAIEMSREVKKCMMNEILKGFGRRCRVFEAGKRHENGALYRREKDKGNELQRVPTFP
jgi:hypothetical protein